MKAKNNIKSFVVIILFILFLSIIIHPVQAFDKEIISTQTITSEVNSETENLIYKLDLNTNKTTIVNLNNNLSKSSSSTITSPSYIPQNFNIYSNNKFLSTYSGYSFYMSPNLSVFPYRTTCKIIAEGGLHHGSGFLVGPNLLLTCAHCVFTDNSASTIYSDWKCYPAYDNGAYNGKVSTLAQVYYPQGFTSSLSGISAQNDWCLCVLNDSLGNDFGWFGCTYYGNNTDLSNMSVTALGYPRENFSGNYQYYSLGTITNVYSYYFDSNAKNYQGMSGGPITRSTDNIVVGLTKGYYSDSPDVTYGVRISEELINLIIDLQ